MAKKSALNMDLSALQGKLRSQFSGLDPNDPSLWPALPRNLLFVAVCAGVVAALWFSWLKGVDEELVAETAKEQQLRETYKQKLVQAVNLDALRKQLEQVQQYVTQLEKQLPSKAEMDALLSDINQAGLGRSLQFELFRPGQVAVREYYAELPITIRVTGSYHDIGLFAGDIANLSRIVTLNNLTLTPIANREGYLAMDGVAKTFRYLDPEEVAAQQKAKGAAK
ncbi:MAG: type 4a pilus biogenesis protein PilO [Hydrogenophaga sp.]|uniref:Type 4a pilus biogenesis protein PilO n=1 Tax=Hydrogenophaga crocea TaxID=2716225 RepID=A0A6G8IML2_9BURK|nr:MULTISPECIES: type 4a pilus biogenesis protein PilO [Hydrogenophaga]MBL0943175.1 type 4a pilus biogenesis protein PilO [Hydrogenophaga sp.]QIM54424.1 type 4a pilus biogenesis protein PilO [Hydrogenophaga crocea]